MLAITTTHTSHMLLQFGPPIVVGSIAGSYLNYLVPGLCVPGSWLAALTQPAQP
jgi:hypothetical protein